MMGEETRTGRVYRRGKDYYFTHPWTGSCVPIVYGQWSPEMKKEMEEVRREVEQCRFNLKKWKEKQL